MSRRLALSLAWLALGCGGTHGDVEFAFPTRAEQDQRAAGPGLRMRWVRELAPKFGGLYRPVERSAPAIDPQSGRVFIGTTQSFLYAFDVDGRQLFRYVAESGIEAEPTLDAAHDELYVATVRGVVHALRAADGGKRWSVELGAAISQAAVLSDDALYVVTDEDSVFALSRSDGSTLWRYKREPRAGLQVAGHAGLLLTEQRLVTGFTDGSIVALSPGDGRVHWLIDTTIDFADPAQGDKGFVDVDATPVQVGELVYAASFLGGFYVIELSTGSVRVRNPELTQITGIAATEDSLLLASAKHGLVCLDLPSLTPRWTRAVRRGAANNVLVDAMSGTAYVTETRGALLAFRLGDGAETGRLQTEYGFTSVPRLQGGHGFALGNAGTLFAFDYAR